MRTNNTETVQTTPHAFISLKPIFLLNACPVKNNPKMIQSESNEVIFKMNSNPGIFLCQLSQILLFFEFLHSYFFLRNEF